MSDLGVVGQPLRVGCKFEPRLSMRRIYNKKCFRVERYQHEVANHYRDIQLQQSPTWQHKQQPGDRPHLPQPKYRPRTRLRPLAPMTVSTSSVQFRCELPIHVQYYPRCVCVCQQHRKLYEIIDNLSQLRLCDNSLPLITLTDCTQQVALYGGSFEIAGSCPMQIPNEARPPT
ncbi:uncharacterized protein LOC108657150 [Drosophila navojoa]|uniref:uncharacterized protein LOC108657150 n=1 Tax=Drosophila navojoa TaxID=7232 RepID=UPI0011BF88C7|nr:uncharacterized protein LOC108657150 [Drosophila navojoa]